MLRKLRKRRRAGWSVREMSPARGTSLWSAQETGPCIVRDRGGQAFAYLYFEDEPGALRQPNCSSATRRGGLRRRIANPTPSEQDVAGLMLRCAEGATTNVLIVLAAPLPPRTHPKVTVVAGATTTEFIASVVPPGTLVLLPEKASALIEKTWQAVAELAVSIKDNNRALRGVIPLEDISNAMQTLQSNCPK
jgi:hypothetical protein